MRRKRSDPLPAFPIAVILKALTDVDVATGFGWVRTRCPFCEDKSGSASVNHEVNAFNCHQCGRKGDSLKLLQTERGLSFTEALAEAKALTGVDSVGPRKTRTRRASDLLKR